MGMFSNLASLAPKPKAKQDQPKPSLELVEKKVEQALESGDYEVVNAGLLAETPTVETTLTVEEEVVKEEPSTDPLLSGLLEQIASQYSNADMQGKLAILVGLNNLLTKE